MIFFLVRKNLFARPFRHGLLALCVAAVAGMQVSAALIESSSRAGLALGLERLGADLVVVPRGAQEAVERAYLTGEVEPTYLPVGTQARVDAFPFVRRTTPQVHLKSLANAACCSVWNVFLIGFDPQTDFVVRPWLEDRPGRAIGADEVLVGAALAGPTGRTMRFFGRDFTVAGSLAPSGMGLDSTVFIPIDSAWRLAEESSERAEKKLELARGQSSALLIKLVPKDEGGKSPAVAAFELEQALPEISVIQREELVLRVDHNLTGAIGALRSARYVVWPLAGLLLGLVFALAANERRAEIGLLRAMGATRAAVFRLIVVEALSIAAAGAAVGLAAALGGARGFMRLIAKNWELPLLWPGPTDTALLALSAFGLALFVAAAAAFYPALAAATASPYEAIRRG